MAGARRRRSTTAEPDRPTRRWMTPSLRDAEERRKAGLFRGRAGLGRFFWGGGEGGGATAVAGGAVCGRWQRLGRGGGGGPAAAARGVFPSREVLSRCARASECRVGTPTPPAGTVAAVAVSSPPLAPFPPPVEGVDVFLPRTCASPRWLIRPGWMRGPPLGPPAAAAAATATAALPPPPADRRTWLRSTRPPPFASCVHSRRPVPLASRSEATPQSTTSRHDSHHPLAVAATQWPAAAPSSWGDKPQWQSRGGKGKGGGGAGGRAMVGGDLGVGSTTTGRGTAWLQQ